MQGVEESIDGLRLPVSRKRLSEASTADSHWADLSP